MNQQIMLATLIASASSLSSFAGDLSADLAIIVAQSSPVEALTTAELVKIFRAEKTKGPDGAKYLLVAREPGSAERSGALIGIYAMTDGEYGKFFLQATFTGAVAASPKQLGSAVAMKQFVAATPGAIGYARGSELDATVKALKIDGKSPGDEGYKPSIPSK